MWFDAVLRPVRARRQRQIDRDQAQGHLLKQRVVKDYARRFNLPVFVESGTHVGNMVEAVRHSFQDVYSIELASALFEQSSARFAGQPHIHLVEGDSGEILGQVLTGIERPCLFWLDGHYSAGITARGPLETPIEQELGHIAAHPLAHQHVILIDDARLFTGAGDYPAIRQLEDWAARVGFTSYTIEDDIIRIHRRE
jgi:hypothetical protein